MEEMPSKEMPAPVIIPQEKPQKNPKRVQAGKDIAARKRVEKVEKEEMQRKNDEELNELRRRMNVEDSSKLVSSNSSNRSNSSVKVPSSSTFSTIVVVVAVCAVAGYFYHKNATTKIQLSSVDKNPKKTPINNPPLELNKKKIKHTGNNYNHDW